MASSASASDGNNNSSSTKSPDLQYRLHLLLFDLQHYSQRQDSRDRLDSVADIHYIGSPYFNDEEADHIKKLTTGVKPLSQIIDEELSQRLQQRMKKRVESDDFRVGTAHEIAPIIAKTLNIDLKRLEKDKSFLRLVDEKGLKLDGEKWDGLPARSFAPKNKGRRKG